MRKICITFAGVPGCGKTPITNYLSTTYNLPVFNNDALRSQIIEDIWYFDSKKHIILRNERLRNIIQSWISFICDASIDRIWEWFKKQLKENDYDIYVISFDLSKEKIIELYQNKEYHSFMDIIDQTIKDHHNFISQHLSDINYSITDEIYTQRIELSSTALRNYL